MGTYIRLIDFTSQQDKENAFLNAVNDNNSKIKFTPNSENFGKIPGSPVAYWVSSAMINHFSHRRVGDYVKTRSGLGCGDNERFMRVWHEVAFNTTKFDAESSEDALESGYKWFPYNKGGDFRKHYGNKTLVLAYDKPAYDVMCNTGNRLPSRHLYFHPMSSWTDVSTYKISLRYYESGYLFGTAGPALFSVDINTIFLIQAYLNSIVSEHFLKILCASIHFNPGDVNEIPMFDETAYNSKIIEYEKENISLSKADWDSFETSWDFKKHPLI